MASASDSDETRKAEPDSPLITLGKDITVHHRGTPHLFMLPESATLADLSEHISQVLEIPATHQKFNITPKTGLLKPPFNSSTNHSLASLAGKKITLLGSKPSEIEDLSRKIMFATNISANRTKFISSPTPRTPSTQRLHENMLYRFHRIEPLRLPHLEGHMLSHALLTQLAGDTGIRSAMRKWKLSVGLLTEMDPAAHTTHQSRTLGLNENQGEVIRLRLRTDDYGGFRDYKTIRKTLCHELAHNVHGDHSRDFWDFMKEIEDHVRKENWTEGGRRLTELAIYEGDDDLPGGGEDVDHGAVVGGRWVLGGASVAEGDASGRRAAAAAAAEPRPNIIQNH